MGVWEEFRISTNFEFQIRKEIRNSKFLPLLHRLKYHVEESIVHNCRLKVQNAKSRSPFPDEQFN